ncbi:hypothetical protein KQ298_04835 [Synechococcus sp. CS-1330]|nr:hypothetical protein [Synechococcus sp. CS-1330]
MGLFPAQAATPLASEAFVPFTPPSAASVGGESLSGLGGAETFDPVGRALLLAGEMPLVWRGTYQPFDNSQVVSAELRLASVKPMGQMIDLRGQLTVGGVTTPVQGNLNAESDQLDLLMLCQCEVAGLEMGGVFTGLQGLQLSGWQAPRLTNPGGRLDLRPLSSASRVATPVSTTNTSSGSAVRGLW